MKRKPLIAGNWKLNGNLAMSTTLAREVAQHVGNHTSVEVVIAPVFTALHSVGNALQSTSIGLSGQDVYSVDEGAFTGEVSAPLLKDAGCKYCIVGHSERRQLFGETDESVHKKMVALLHHAMTPILCVGETLEERRAGKTLQRVLSQVKEAIAGLDAVALAPVVIAYEPVWAIGTGQNATPNDAQEVHAAIRGLLCNTLGNTLGESLRILYGGSVKASNAAELLAQPDIDGALVGGASLKIADFAPIIEAAWTRATRA
jgi:triosephosphate isomerase